jgi:hypothetical protein
MIFENFSQSAQRIIALALAGLVLLVAVLFVILPFLSSLAGDLARLDAQRTEIARAEAFAAMPAPRAVREPDPSLFIRAALNGGASEQLSGHLAQLAAARSINIDIDPVPSSASGPPSLLSLSVRITGEQSAVLAFLGDVEAGQPLVRFQRLTMSGLPSIPITPAGGLSAIMPQSPNAAVAAVSPTSPDVAPGEPAAAPAEVTTMLEARGTLLALWGARR